LGKSIKFSLDLTHMAYVASRDKKFVVVLDGKFGPSFDAIGQETPVFSLDGKHIAYKAKKAIRGAWLLTTRNKRPIRPCHVPCSVPIRRGALHRPKD